MVLIGVVQFVNTFSKKLLQWQPVKWTDGLAAALGITSVFLMVAIYFGLSAFSTHQNRTLDKFEQPAVVEGEHLANVEAIRQAFNNESDSYKTSILIGAGFPMMVFAFSIVRLFTKRDDPELEESA